MKIFSPVKSNKISQKFGQNLCDFYAKLGLRGHNGVDYIALIGTELRFNCDARGEVIEVDSNMTYGKKIVIMTKDKISGKLYKHYYGHLLDFAVKEGDFVDTGDLLGRCDNSGIYTTGSHLHYGLYECTINAQTMNIANGYGGAIDPVRWYVPMFVCEYLAKQEQAVGILQKLIEAVKELLKYKK
jgi:murein DD-endopeptidase MepM/ murein hydrolase activator NlpD